MKTHKPSEIEKCANMTDNWQECVRMAWDTKEPLMDWLGFEATLRSYAKVINDGNLDEIIAAFTKRGHTLSA